MGMNIEIVKTKEDLSFVHYNYQFLSLDNEKKLKTCMGSIKISKESGAVYTVQLASGDSGARAKCAAWALMRHWKKGEYPDKTYWNS